MVIIIVTMQLALTRRFSLFVFSEVSFLSFKSSRSRATISIIRTPRGTSLRPNLCKIHIYIANYLLICFKDKLKHLGIPELAEPGPGEVEEEYLDELAEEEETLADVLGVEETRKDSDELGRGGEEAKLVNADSVIDFILLEVDQYKVRLG